MTEKQAQPLYSKVGRKYVPIAARWHEDANIDQMPIGTFRLTYAYADGGKLYEYNVEPATAPAVAAMMVAKVAMEDAIREASMPRPSGTTRYTKAQQACIEQFRCDMAGLAPDFWAGVPSHKVADAGIKAVLEYRP